jgi:hypothetical protein
MVYSKAPGEDIADWGVRMKGWASETDLVKAIHGVRERSSSMLTLEKSRKIRLYHATERRTRIFPLRESQYPKGLFICTGEERNARKIKSDHSLDMGVRLKVVRIEIPETLFRKLFIQDRESGRPGDELSEKAYDHAYVLPVSRYPLFNYYVEGGVIEEA